MSVFTEHHQQFAPTVYIAMITTYVRNAMRVVAFSTILILGGLFCPQQGHSQCDYTAQCSSTCSNSLLSFSIEVDSVYNLATRTYFFHIKAEAYIFDRYPNAVNRMIISCVEGGNASGSTLQCAAGLPGDTGCVSCSIDGHLKVGWCDPVVVFRATILSYDNNSISVICRCKYDQAVSVPYLLEIPDERGLMVCEAKLGDPINAVNGNLYLTRTDVTLEADAGFPIVFERYYNSYSTASKPDPTAMWTHSYGAKLYETSRWYPYNNPNFPYVVSAVTLVEGNGKAVHFNGQGMLDSLHFHPEETDYSLDYDADSNTYKVTTDDGTQMKFIYCDTLSFKLSKVTDRNGSQITLSWFGDELSRISADSLKCLNLFYTNAGGKTVLYTVADADSSVLVRYSYVDSTGFLSKVTYADSSWEQYDFGTATADRRRIVKTTTSDGAEGHFKYGANGVVTEAYNDVSPVVEHLSMIYRQDSVEFYVDTVVEGVDTTFDTVITARVHETEVTNNYDTAHVASYYSHENIGGWGRYLEDVVNSNCGGCGSHFTHDWQGRVTSVEYANGRVDAMSYDDRGNIDTLIRGSGSGLSITTTFEYDTTFNLPTRIKMASVAKPAGYREIALVRDSNGNAIQRIETGWLDSSTSYTDTSQFEYNSRGQLTKIDGPRTDVADTIALRYDSTTFDFLHAIFPNGDTVTFGARDIGPGGIPYVFDPNGVKTAYTYDERGRIKRVLENALSADSAATDVELNFKGELESIALPLGNTYTLHYDKHDWLTYLLNESGDSIAYGYDNMSNLSSVRHYDAADQLRQRDSLTYNWKSQLTKRDSYEYRYDAMGWLDTIIVAALSDSTFLDHDQFGRVREIVEVADDGSHLTTHLAYDIHDNLTRVTDPDSNTFYFWYDDRGLLLRDSCAVTGVTEYAYDAAGNLVNRSDANGTTVEYEYDALGRVTLADYPDSTLDVTYEYDGDSTSTYARGRLTREAKDGVAISYQYDAFGRVVEEEHELDDTTYNVSYTYNKNGEVSAVTYPSGVEYTYSYDSEGRVSRVSAQFGQGQPQVIADSIAYEPFGAIKSVWSGNGIRTSYSYDTRGFLAGISTGADSVLNRSYTYDTTGNILAYYDTLNTSNNTSYSYDEQGRLVRMIRPSLAQDTIQYEYFDNDNRCREIIGNDTTAYTYMYNRLTALSGATLAGFVYDNNGNLVMQVVGTDTTEYGYDEANRLISVTQNDTTYQQSYNSRSQRLSVTTPGGTSRYVYSSDGVLLTEYFAGDWETDYVYLYGQPIARVWAYNEEVDTAVVTHFDIGWYHNDHLGTPMAITDSAKTVRWSAQYYPFGALASENVSVQNDLRFPGQYHDRSTDLYYNMFRTYRHDLGRYLTPDPIGLAGGTNLYGYAGQNPINYADPMGLWSVRLSFYYGWGGTVSFGSDEGSGFVGGEFGPGYGAGVVIEPTGDRPRHLRIDNPEFEHAFTAGMSATAGLSASAFGFGGGIGGVVYGGVGIQQTDNGIQGCYAESEGSILGDRLAATWFADAYKSFSVDPGRFKAEAWGVEAVVRVNIISLGYTWKR
jgi:RHS repeat-associated protein